MRAVRPGLTPLLAAALLLAACDASGPQSQATTFPSSPSPSAAASPTISVTTGPKATTAPAATPTRPPASPSASPRPSATTAASAGPLGTPGSLASCTGTDANRTFFAGSAAAYSWDVYCAALPKGWFLEAGSRKSGLLSIAYKTASGLRFELKEGAICTGTPAACGPLDSTIGTAMFGDRQGQLGRLGANLVLYVSPGSNPAWQATGIGLDETTFRSFAAALVKVPG